MRGLGPVGVELSNSLTLVRVYRDLRLCKWVWRQITTNRLAWQSGNTGPGRWKNGGGYRVARYAARITVARGAAARRLAWLGWAGSAGPDWIARRAALGMVGLDRIARRRWAWWAAFAPQAGRLDPHRRGIPRFDRPAPLATITLFQTRVAHFFSFGPPTPFFLQTQSSNPTPADPLKRKKGPPAGTHK
jgi:hypothetical protein